MTVKPASSIANHKFIELLNTVTACLVRPDDQLPWPDTEMVRQANLNLVGWDRWLATNRRSLSPDELQLHESTVRFMKGIVKLWRVQLSKGRPST